MQEIAWYLSLILIGLLAVVFLVFIRGSASEDSYEEVARRDYAWRGKLFWVGIIAGIVITITTLLPWPHAVSANASNVKTVEVVASQWHWDIKQTEFRVGETIDFQVSSKDVNHGFGIYDANMTILGQIQAMPGYTNSLRHTFTRPGEYQILCMEYCGVAHHSMITTLTVLPAEQ